MKKEALSASDQNLLEKLMNLSEDEFRDFRLYCLERIRDLKTKDLFQAMVNYQKHPSIDTGKYILNYLNNQLGIKNKSDILKQTYNWRKNG